MFQWRETLKKLRCPNQQVNALNDVLKNIFSNFIPNKFLTVRPRQATWVTTSTKNFIREKNRAYKSFIKMVNHKKGLKESNAWFLKDINNRGCQIELLYENWTNLVKC